MNEQRRRMQSTGCYIETVSIAGRCDRRQPAPDIASPPPLLIVPSLTPLDAFALSLPILETRYHHAFRWHNMGVDMYIPQDEEQG